MKKPLSAMATKIQASTTLAIDALFKKMQEDGVDVVGFGAGEPDFNTPDHIKAAAKKAIDENFTRYTAAAGIIPLKKAICARLLADCGLSYEPAQIVISNGAKHSLSQTLCCLLNPGDEVILPAPYWVSYLEMVNIAGGTPVVVEATEAADFKITAEQLKAAVTDKTKALILCSPSNPTGMVYTKAELQAIADVCVQNGIYIVADEIYYKLIYDGKEFVSVASLSDAVKDITIVVNGVSKTYAMTGWRIGYIAAPAEIAKVVANYQSHAASAPNSVAQKAAMEALQADQSGIEAMREEFQKRRNFLVERMNQIEGVSCKMPEGAFYVMMNIEKLIGKTLHGVKITCADDFSKLFLEKGLVATVPCEGFGAPTFVRWSYATSMKNIETGLDRLAKFLA